MPTWRQVEPPYTSNNVSLTIEGTDAVQAKWVLDNSTNESWIDKSQVAGLIPAGFLPIEVPVPISVSATGLPESSVRQLHPSSIQTGGLGASYEPQSLSRMGSADFARIPY